MLRKTLAILSLIGLLLSVGLWGVTYFNFVAVTSPRGPSWQLRHGCFAVTWSTLPPDPLPPNRDLYVNVGTITFTGDPLLVNKSANEIVGAKMATFKTGCTFRGFDLSGDRPATGLQTIEIRVDLRGFAFSRNKSKPEVSKYWITLRREEIYLASGSTITF